MAVGQIGIPPDTFKDMTPAEFILAWFGWMEYQEHQMRQAWERERWSVYITTCLQLESKDRSPMLQMFPLPWDAPTESPQEISMEERRRRVRELTL